MCDNNLKSISTSDLFQSIVLTPRGQISLLEWSLCKVKAISNLVVSPCFYLLPICMSDIVLILAPTIYLCHIWASYWRCCLNAHLLEAKSKCSTALWCGVCAEVTVMWCVCAEVAGKFVKKKRFIWKWAVFVVFKAVSLIISFLLSVMW